MKINLYDFDNTIYHGDSSTDFFFFALMHYPKIIIILPKIILYVVKYKFKIVTKTEMKEVIFSFLKYVPDVDSLVQKFWEEHRIYIKDFYLEKKHNHDVIISASPEFLLTPICKELKVQKLIGSKVDSKSGKFTGPNCHGSEKVRRLNEVYSEYKVNEAYSDSRSDIPILKLAENELIIKKEELIPVEFEN